MDSTILFDCPRPRYLRISEDVVVKLRPYGPNMTILEFVDVHGNDINKPEGFKLYDITNNYISGFQKTLNIFERKNYYPLVHTFSYEFEYNNKSYELSNKRQWESNVKWD